MEAKSISKHVKISPRKTRLVVDLIRGKNAQESVNLLKYMNKRAAGVVSKTLESAIANAKNKELDIESLWVKTITVDGGATQKRYLPRAMGRANTILHRTSHITVILTDGGEGLRKAEKKLEQKKKGFFKKRTTKKTSVNKITKKTKTVQKDKKKKTAKREV